MKINNKWLIVVVVLIVVVSLVVLANSGGESGKFNGEEQKFKDFIVHKGKFKTVVTANGSVIPIDRVEIKSKASGLVEELPIEQGDHIKAGDLIARLDQKDERAAVSQAQADYDIALAELKNAQREHLRKDELYAQRLISEEERDQIELNLAIAKGKLVQASTALERAKERLSESVVRAPINGVILQKYVEKGQIIASGISNVSGGTPIADIADMSSVYIQAGVDEIDIGKIRNGQTATVIADAYPNLKFKGEIVRIAPEAKIQDNVTLFDVIILVENRDAKLKSGMNTSIEITIVEKDDVLLVPNISLQPEESDQRNQKIRIVMLKRGNGYESKQIETGLYNFKETEVLAGLEEGDVLGVPMSSRLKESNNERENRMRSTRTFGTGN
jgi:HlyD family secretion protein